MVIDFTKILQQTNQHNKTFYAILLNEQRFLYLDCELKLIEQETKYHTQISQIFYRCILCAIRKRYQNLDLKFFTWQANRYKTDKEYKISFHIIVPQIFKHFKDIANDVSVIKKYLYYINHRFGNAIDNGVYHCIQAWRLPYNNKINQPESTLKPLHNTNNLNILNQIAMNFLQPTKHHNLIQMKLLHPIKQNYYLFNQILTTHPTLQKYYHIFKDSKWYYNTYYSNNIDKKTTWTVTNLYYHNAKKYHKKKRSLVTIYHKKWIQITCCKTSTIDTPVQLTLNKLKKPWFFTNLHDIIGIPNILALEKLVLQLITYEQLMLLNSKRFLFTDYTLQIYPQPNIQYSFYSTQYLACNECYQHANKTRIHIQFRTPNHRHYQNHGKISLYCQNCKKYIN